jgi:inner membrane protein
MSEISDFGKWISTSVTVKLVLIGFLFLVLLIPSAMIQGLIREREGLSNEVAAEIGAKWGKSQIITGPVLSLPALLPAKKTSTGETPRITAHFLPDLLKVTTTVVPEIRYRGMYKVVVYRSKITLEGIFKKPDAGQIDLLPENLVPAEAFLSLGIPDMRGIQEAVEIRFGDSIYQANPGLKNTDVIDTGVTTPIDLSELLAKGEVPFTINLSLNGSDMAGFVPVGRVTEVQVNSSWSNPSFEGAFLPDERNVSDSGFSARWKVLHLNRNYPQQWTGDAFELDGSAFGVRFLLPVDHYQKAMRAVKYSAMFTSLTFLVLFFIEILYRRKMHPVQYLLVGVALLIFYTLLLSFSEQIKFNYAYVISAMAVVGLIGLYAGSIFKNARMGIVTTGFLGMLYAFLFILLQLQDYALLLGSIGLFVIIAAVMYFSRKVSWYNEVA